MYQKRSLKLIQTIDGDKISSENSKFYQLQLSRLGNEELKIKYNNKILHQSKLINYFSGNISKEKI